eukprot:Sro129_g061630.2  (112) ;mRNA; r:77484-78142
MVYWWMLGAEPTAEEPEGVIVKNRRSLQGTHCTGTDCCTTYISGDLHLNTWKGESFDCHGECDLVMVKAPSLATTVHVRTTTTSPSFPALPCKSDRTSWRSLDGATTFSTE